MKSILVLAFTVTFYLNFPKLYSQDEFMAWDDIIASYDAYLGLKDDNIPIRKNDTLKFINEALEIYKGSAAKSNYLSNIILPDDEYTNIKVVGDNLKPRFGRISKRKDFNILVIIYFELYLKLDIPKSYDIATIYLTPDNYRERTYNWRYIRPKPLESANKLTYNYGNQYIDCEEYLNYIKFEKNLVPGHLKMIELYEAFEKWYNKVLEVGSLEEARKKGLDPFEGTGFRFNIVLVQEAKGYNDSAVYKEYDSFFPRFPYDEKRTKELTDKSWRSTYIDFSDW